MSDPFVDWSFPYAGATIATVQVVATTFSAEVKPCGDAWELVTSTFRPGHDTQRETRPVESVEDGKRLGEQWLREQATAPPEHTVLDGKDWWPVKRGSGE
jgi:hypothetical protein